MNPRVYLRILSLGLLSLFIPLACRTVVQVPEEDLTPDQYFQRAIEATDLNNYRLAMSYYEAFVDRYPDDMERNIWASYEIAFLHHKMGDDDTALELLDALIERYDSRPEGVEYPTAPLVLAEKVKANILADRAAESNRSGWRPFQRFRERSTEPPGSESN